MTLYSNCKGLIFFTANYIFEYQWIMWKEYIFFSVIILIWKDELCVGCERLKHSHSWLS